MIYSYDVVEEKYENIREVNLSNQETESINSEPTVGKIDEAPEFLRDNEFIHRGYRINFNSSWNIIKSLFVLHNEFVNVWSHIIGSLFVGILILYTFFYIGTHKAEIYEALDNKWGRFNEDWKFRIYSFQNMTADIQSTLEGGKEMFNEYAALIKNSSFDYYNSFEEKMKEYKDYFEERIHCIECITMLMNKLSEMGEMVHENFNEMKEKFMKMYQNNMKTLNITKFDFDFAKYFDEMNEKLRNFKEEIISKTDSKDLIDKNPILIKGMSNKMNKWPLFVFLLSAIVCQSLSAIFHLFFVHSQKLSKFLGKLDYVGIAVLIFGSCVAPYYYFFYCSQKLLLIYISSLTFFSVLVLALAARDDFSHREKRWFRGALFLCYGLSSALPLIQLIFFGKTIPGNIPYPTLINWVLGGFSYIVGCIIYIFRFPERNWPGKFCIWGSSHQIWHFMVFCGIVFHFFGCLDTYYDRMSTSCY